MVRRVLITGARAAAALDLARDFAVAGWQVHLADSRKVRMTGWSRLAAHHHLYPPPRQQGEAFRARIVDLVKQHDIALVVPTCEEVFYLAVPALRQHLDQRLFAPDLETLRSLHDKLAFARLCAGWDLSIPESHAVDSNEALSQFSGTSREWVFKPRFSRFGDRAVVGPEAAELARLVHLDPSSKVRWMAQRRVHGEEACFHAAAQHGRIVAFAAYGSDWRLGGGASYAFEPLAQVRYEALLAIAQRLATCAQIHGQFACDVLFDASDMPFLIECNPRATSGVHLLTGDGGLARAIGNGIVMPNRPCQAAYLAPAMWLFGLPRALRQGRMAAWRALLASGRDVISSSGDFKPLAGALVDAGGFLLTGLRHNVSTHAATTLDIEWNGEELNV